MFSLKDKAAVVTGGASGIGEAIAHALARAGANVFITDLNPKLGHEVAAAINQAPYDHGRADFIECDVSDESSVRKCADRVLTIHQRCEHRGDEREVNSRC